MFRRLQGLVDPFAFAPSGAPPDRVSPFLAEHLRPLRTIIALSLLLTIVGAAIEVWLIGFAGTLVDTLASTSPVTLLSTHGTGLVAAALIVLVRSLPSSAKASTTSPSVPTPKRWSAGAPIAMFSASRSAGSAPILPVALPAWSQPPAPPPPAQPTRCFTR
jgi:hypothetical protein